MKNLRHPSYGKRSKDWTKWRLTFEGGDAFINKYLKRFSSREKRGDFRLRRAMTYSPSFAKEAIIDIRNAIAQRMPEVVRTGSQSYLEACRSNIDGKGTSMSQFMGSMALDELMTMEKVGIWIDKDENGAYACLYRVEDIYNWDDELNPTSLLLRDHEISYDDEYGLLTSPKEVYRHAYLEDGKVHVAFLNANKEKIGAVEVLDFDKIPFVSMNIVESLLKDTSNYQIALLNIASSDINYILKANFPFYVEQYDQRADIVKKYTKETDTEIDPEGKSIDVGVVNGRRYPIGTNAPSFISPSIEPLTASMEKQTQLKEEIRLLVNLSLSNISPTRASRESKQQDERGLEAGLSWLGLELEKAENKIAEFWKLYTGDLDETSVVYPVDYSLKTDKQRYGEVEDFLTLVDKVPSLQAKKELLFKAIRTLFNGRLASDKINTMIAEIQELSVVVSDPTLLFQDIENHLVGYKSASMIRGYDAEESAQAIIDHTDKLARIAIAQSEAATIKPTTPGVETVLTEKEKKKQ